MPNIFIFTAGNPIARRHLQDSVANPINREKVLSNFDPAEHENLEKIYGEGKGFYAWGAIPGPQNTPTWNAMRPGDYVLCVYDKAYHYAAQVLGNYDNERLARALWQQDEAGRTWQQLYFFTRPQEINRVTE